MTDTVSAPTVMPPAETAQSTEIALSPPPAPLTNVGSALAAQVQATVQIRTMVALSRPRDWDLVRQRMLKECARPAFCESALYSKPVGNTKVEGFSIRFAEALARSIGNLTTETIVIDESQESVQLRVVTTDLESNSSWSTDVSVKKTVERRKPKEGQTVISSRRNSAGDLVYLIEASDDEMLVKQNMLISKAARNNIVRLCPGDLLDDCEAKIKAVIRARTKEDPDGERKRIFDKFGEFGVEPPHIKEFLGHDLGPGQISLAELDELRKVYAGLSQRETTWAEVMRSKAEALKGSTASGSPAASAAGAAVREKLEKKQ